MRVLLVEDDHVLGDAMVHSLEQAGYVVDWAKNGTTADIALQDQIYDLALLDLGLPRMDGFSVLQRLRARNNSLPVLIVTARDSLEARVAGLDLGADDYVLKPFHMQELLARARAHVRRTHTATSTNITYGALTYNAATRLVHINGQLLNLSARELSILEALLMRVGKVITKEMLVEKLCNWSEELSINAIEVYVYRLRKKLQSYGIDITTIRGLGYMLNKNDA